MISFNTFGHRNIKAVHRNTIEFTKEKEITPKGDCILGVNSDFDSEKVRKFISSKAKIKVKIIVDNVSDEFECTTNPKFNGKNEMVFRLGGFASERTLGLRATKACRHIKREIAEKMKQHGKKMKVIIE